MGSRKNILILIVLAVGLGLGLFLVSKPQIFRSRASVPGSVAFEGPNIRDISGEKVATAPDIAIRLTTGFDSAIATPAATSSPGATTSPTSSPGSTTAPSASPGGSSTGQCPSDGSDGGSINTNWDQTVPVCTRGDFNGDGKVDYSDFGEWYRKSGQTGLFNRGGLVSEVSAQVAASGRKMFTTDGSPVTTEAGPGKTWAQVSGEIKRQCIAAGKSTVSNVNETCSPDIVTFIPAGWDSPSNPDSMLVGIGKKLWWSTSLPAGSSQRSYLIGTNADTGANWTADAQMVQICAATGRSSDCKPDLLVNFPEGWDDGAEPVQLIGVGNRVWIRGSIDSSGSRTMYTSDNRPKTTNAGPGKTWAEASPNEIRQQCITSGKSTAANVNETCSPDVLAYVPAGWDNFGNKPLMLVGVRDKVWVGESLPRGGTGRNWVIGTSPLVGVNWSADAQIPQICQVATGNSNCNPSLVSNFPLNWDSFGEATQTIGVNNKVWVRGKVQSTGTGSSCEGFVHDCEVNGKLGTMWCTPGVKDSSNRCIEDAQNTKCYLEKGSTVRDTCKVIDSSLPAANYKIDPQNPLENQPFTITIDGVAQVNVSNVALRIGTNYYYLSSATGGSSPYAYKSTTGLAKGIYELQLVAGCKYTDSSGAALKDPDCSSASITKFAAADFQVGNVPEVSFGTYKITESADGKIVKEGTPQKMDTKTVVVNYALSPGFNEKTISVEFTSPTGEKDVQTAKIKLISTAPSITNVDCNVDLASKGLAISILGDNFGGAQGKVSVEGQSTSPTIKSWGEKSVSALLPNVSGQEFKVNLTRSDGQIAEKLKCAVGTQSLQFRANVFCQQIWPFDVPDVELTFVDRNSGGTETTEPEKVTIDREGFVKGIKTKLQSGRNYALAIKAPKALRKVVNITASTGTINLPDMILPVGDISGENNRPDGKINSLDRSALGSDWRNLTVATTPRLADFNKDLKVNSIDWACMRKGFAGQGLTTTGEDEPLPKPGAQVSYKFSPDPLVENQDIDITFEDPSPSSGTFDFVAMVVDGNYKAAQWLGGPGGGLVGPPYIGKITGGLPAGDHTFQLAGKCKYTDLAGKGLTNPDCSGADVVKFEQVSKRVLPPQAPAKPLVNVSCTNNVAAVGIGWAGAAGKGADADTANKGKTGFYVDISDTDSFAVVNNKFVEGDTLSTVAPAGFVVANTGRVDTGSPLTLTLGKTYYVRVFNGVHSPSQSFVASCDQAT